LDHSLESSKTLEKSLSLFQERDRFAHGATRTEIVAQFVKSATEACCRFEASETTHGIVALLDPSVILLQPIIEVLVRPMLDTVAHDLAYSPRIGTMPICRDRLWRMANHSNRLLEQSLSRLHISFLAQHGIDQIAIVVDGPIQITPLSMHFYVGFILCWLLGISVLEKCSSKAFDLDYFWQKS